MATKNEHDEKVTFYCTTDQLMDVEQAVLALKRQGLRRGLDRGTVIRAALDLTVREFLANEKRSRLYEFLITAQTEGGIPDPTLFT